MKEEEDKQQIDDLYEAINKDVRKQNEIYKNVKYKLYFDSIEEVYKLLKEDIILMDKRDFELVRSSARKTALILLDEVHRTTKNPDLHEYFSKLAAIIASD